jgi:hypothetical protein
LVARDQEMLEPMPVLVVSALAAWAQGLERLVVFSAVSASVAAVTVVLEAVETLTVVSEPVWDSEAPVV